MAVNFHTERNGEDANLFVSGSLVAPAALELFNQVIHLLDGGYNVTLHFNDAEFVGLGAVRALRSAALRAEDAGVALRIQPSPSVYRVADLVGESRWSPLPAVEFEGDWVTA
jgi:hypothetical protein